MGDATAFARAPGAIDELLLLLLLLLQCCRRDQNRLSRRGRGKGFGSVLARFLCLQCSSSSCGAEGQGLGPGTQVLSDS